VIAGVLRERAAGERRVALDPDGVRRLVAAGLQVVIEHEAGAAAWFTDEAYRAAGARTLARPDVLANAEVILSVGPPAADAIEVLRAGQCWIGLLSPMTNTDLVREFNRRGVTAVSLDGLPRTLTRAQGMDALSSQANAAGYRAALLAANHFDRFFPLLITAAGTAKPATVLVLGAGVAGLQAIATARRLGAVVTGYDVRPEAAAEVKSLGARFLELSAQVSAAGAGGYARALTDAERAAQSAELVGHVGRHDVVICTAQVPGRPPPLLVTAEAVSQMRAGSVIIDLAASALGGNVAGSIPDRTVVTPNGVTIVGAPDLAASLAVSASASYARNIGAMVLHLVADGHLRIDLADEIQAGVVFTHAGRVVHEGLRERIEGVR
jgi:NAD(P) transhydrogenase subunit alpha